MTPIIDYFFLEMLLSFFVKISDLIVMNLYGDYDEKQEISNDSILPESRLIELESSSLQVCTTLEIYII